MRTALSVLLTCWPPAPEARKTSMRRSLSSISTSISSASGRTATVAAEVWMRPCVSVCGTRWTRWTPASNLRRANTPLPPMPSDDLLDAAEVALGEADHLDPPALQLGVALVHAQEVAREQRRLVAARAGTDLDDRVLLVGDVLRQQAAGGCRARGRAGGPGARAAPPRRARACRARPPGPRAWPRSRRPRGARPGSGRCRRRATRARRTRGPGRHTRPVPRSRAATPARRGGPGSARAAGRGGCGPSPSVQPRSRSATRAVATSSSEPLSRSRSLTTSRASSSSPSESA